MILHWKSHRLTRDTLVVFSGQALSLGLGLAGSAALARGLGPAGLRTFALIGVVVAVGVTVADLGLTTGTVREVASHPEDARVAGALRRRKLAAALLVAVAVVGSGPWWRRALHLGASPAGWFVLAGASVVATSVSGIVSPVLHGLRRFGTLVAAQILNFGLTATLMIGLYATGRLTVGSALVVGIVTALAAAAVAFRLLPSGWRAALLRADPGDSERMARLARFGRWLWGASVLSLVGGQLDLVLVSRWQPAATAGVYALAVSLFFKLVMVQQALRAVLLPEASALSSVEQIRGYLRQMTARCGVVALAMLVAVPLIHPFVVIVYGDRYEKAARVLDILMVVAVIDVVTLPITLLAYPLDAPSLLLASDVTNIVLLTAAATVLIPRWGLYGAAVARLTARVGSAMVVTMGVSRRISGSAGGRRPAREPFGTIPPPLLPPGTT